MSLPRSPLARHRLAFRLLLWTTCAVCVSSLVVAAANVHWAWQLAHAADELRLARGVLMRSATQLESVETGTRLQTWLAEEQRQHVVQATGSLMGRMDDLNVTLAEVRMRVMALQCLASGGTVGCPAPGEGKE